MSSVYPTPEEIVFSLTELANKWRLAAVFWHLYFAVFVGALIFGIRPSKRIAGLLLALPFLSVSILAFTIFNPVNGIGFAVLGILLVYASFKMLREQVQIAPWWVLIAGAFMFVFGWIYPHFLDPSSPYSFLYSSPVGVNPCPTLSTGIGLALIMNSLNSRKVSLILGIAGVIYGLTGFAMLGVTIDLILLFGAIVTLIFAFVGKNHVRKGYRIMETVRTKVGVSLFTGSVQFLIALTLAEILYPNYSLSANPLSDLGAGFFQPASKIFNVSVIIFGILVILGAYFAMRAFHSKSLVAVMLLAGIGIAGVGFFTETILVPHLIFSFMAFFFSGVAAVLSFRVVTSPFRYFGTAMGIFELAALVLFIAGMDFGLGHGGIQRMVVYLALIWYIGFGSHTIRG